LGDQLLDVRPDLVLGQLFQRLQVDLLDQPSVQPHLGVEQLVAEQRIGGLRRDRLGAGIRKDRPRHAFERGRRLVQRRHQFRRRGAASGETADHARSSIRSFRRYPRR